MVNPLGQYPLLLMLMLRDGSLYPAADMLTGLGGGNGMTPHISGTSLDAQIRYATGAHDIVKRYLAGEPQERVNLIVENGEVSCLALWKAIFANRG
jgi:formate dehydrogenase